MVVCVDERHGRLATLVHAIPNGPLVLDKRPGVPPCGIICQHSPIQWSGVHCFDPLWQLTIFDTFLSDECLH